MHITKLTTLLIAFITAAYEMISPVNAAGVIGVDCTSSTDPDVIAAGGFGQCDQTPDAMVVKFYKLGLCTEKPTYKDYSSCEFLFDNPNGKEVTLSTTSSDKLIEGRSVSVSEGSYKYAMLVISNTLGLKESLTFDNPIGAMNGSSGRYCRTNGNPHKDAPTSHSDGMFDCSSSATGSPRVSEVTYKGFWDPDFDENAAIAPGNMPFTTGLFDEVASADAKFDVILVSTEGSLASINTNLNAYGAPYASGDASRIWGVQTFTNPKKIDFNTTNLDLSFGIRDGIIVNFGQYCLNGGKCLEMSTISKFEFKITTN